MKAAPIEFAYRRYLTAAKAALLDGRSRKTPHGYAAWDIFTDEWTEFYVVPDDDPRVDTVKKTK